MLEDKEGGFSREVVITTVRKRFESEAFKELLPSRRNKKPLHGDQAFVAGDGRGSGRQNNGSSGRQRQGHGCSSRGQGGSGLGRGGEKSGGGGRSESSGGGKRVCFQCKSEKHVVRQCPEQFCWGCEKKGNHVAVCKDVAETVMAVGGAPAKNGSSTSPEGKCLVSYGPGGVTICA